MDTMTHHCALPSEALPDGDRRAIGQLGERLAARHLGDDGLEVLARNWRIARAELRGELDLVAVEPATATLVVCEVKTRRDAARFGGATAALEPRQQRRLRALTAAFLREHPGAFAHVRLDLVAIDLGRAATLTHVLGLA